MITQERLKELVEYDPETGVFRWIKLVGKKGKIGKIIGSKHSQGYLEAQIDNNRVFLHRMAWLYMTGELPKPQIDHVNGDRSDNRWSNLREAVQQQNSGNMRKRPSNKSGVKGICQYKDRWRAYIHLNYKTRYLGSFHSKEEAAMAYANAAKAAFGDYARFD